MNDLIIRARRYDTGEPVVVLVRNGRIQSVIAWDPALPCEQLSELLEANSPRRVQAEFVAPGFCDIQVNGALGHNFTTPDLRSEQIRAVSEELLQHGTTTYLPTLITSDVHTLEQGLCALADAVERDSLVGQMVLGFHLEGPYICPEPGPRGAHPAEHVRAPNRDEFRRLQEAARGGIRLVTLAPTWPGVTDFIAWLTEQGVLVALGHHNASAQQIAEAVRAGARLCTHLGNGCDLLLPRHPNYLWDQLANDELWASLICDGHHLPASVIKCIVRCKTPQRCVLISDASPLAGLPPGHYSVWGKSVELQASGRTALRDERSQTVLAGAARFLDVGVVRVWRDGEVAFAQAVAMASVQARQLLGLPHSFLEIGSLANLVLFDLGQDQLQVRSSVLGERVLTS